MKLKESQMEEDDKVSRISEGLQRKKEIENFVYDNDNNNDNKEELKESSFKSFNDLKKSKDNDYLVSQSKNREIEDCDIPVESQPDMGYENNENINEEKKYNKNIKKINKKKKRKLI